jgi:heterodisulfide reductase subunit C
MNCWRLDRVQFVSETCQETCDPSFAQEVKERSGADLDRCYQCLTCSLSCPVEYAMDYSPNKIIRMVQLGLKDEVLKSSTIWLCATCETCVARCPNDVNVLRVMDTLREMSLQEKVKGKETVIPTFHDTFLGSIRLWGRSHELSMELTLKVRTKDLFTDFIMGIKMILKGKLRILPIRIKGLKQVKDIFEKTKGAGS